MSSSSLRKEVCNELVSGLLKLALPSSTKRNAFDALSSASLSTFLLTSNRTPALLVEDSSLALLNPPSWYAESMLCLALQEVPAVEFLAIFEAARRVPSVREIVTNITD